jgi:hypothetical protein
MSDDALTVVSEITEFNELNDFMRDDQLEKALEIVVKCIVNKGHIPPQKVPDLIVELQALSTKFAILAAYYGNMGKGGVREAQMKNVYYTLKEALPKLVDSMKYQLRTGSHL